MYIEKFQWKDTSRIVQMICDVWHLEKMFKNTENGMVFSQEYLYDVLSHATDVYVVKKDCMIIGFLALAISSQKNITIPNEYYQYLYHQHNHLHQITRYRQMMKEYHQHCFNMLQKVDGFYDGEIILFMVDPMYQHQGIGTKLYEFAQEVFLQNYCQQYILFTDTTCSYIFYDHHQMKRLASYQKDKNFIMYLYGKALSMISNE